MRSRLLVVLCLASVFAVPAIAEKPEWAGKGKPTEEQKAAQKEAMKAKEDLDDDDRDDDLDDEDLDEDDSDDDSEEAKDKKEKKDKKNKKDKEAKAGNSDGPAELENKKADQERKELGKGSEKGQESREANSKKWWKFWGE